MIYPTKEYGTAVGEIVVALSAVRDVSGVEVRMTSDEITAKILLGEDVKVRRKEQGSANERRKRVRYGNIECDGQSHTVKEWANILGVAENTITNRMRSYGNPKGRKGPTDEDAVKMS